MPAVFGGDQLQTEDLSPVLILSDQKKTPVFSLLPKLDPLVSVDPFSWGITGMGARRPRGVPENKDVDAFEGDTSSKLRNRWQEFWRTPRVTKIAEKLNKDADKAMKYNGQVTKKTAEQRRDVETRILSTADSYEDDGVDIGEEFKAFGHAIDDGTLTDTDPVTAIPLAYKTPTAQIYTGALVDLKDTHFSDMLQSRFDTLGATDDLVLIAGSALRRQISQTFGYYVANPPTGYTLAVKLDRITYDLTKKKYTIPTVEILETENGVIAIVGSQFIGSDGVTEPYTPNTKYGYGIDFAERDDGVGLRPLMYCDHTELEYRGGARSGLIDSILGLKYGDPRMHLKIAPSS